MQPPRKSVRLPLGVECHEHRRSTWRCATVREMKEGPSGFGDQEPIPSHRKLLRSKARTADVNGRLWGARASDWADIQERTARPVYEAVLERMRVMAGARNLDVGCGAGMAARIAAWRGAQVSGIDAAEPLLEIARRRTPTGDFRRGDLEELPFNDRSFDVVTGFNSFQYAGNPVVALAEARRVTRPGGTIVVTPWGNPDGMEAASLVAALRPLMPPPPPGAPGPFALSDESALRRFAIDAGLAPARSSMSIARSSIRTRRRRSVASTRRASPYEHGELK
jgi:SAM-dependent methyltransferase